MFILPLHQHPLIQVGAEVAFHQGIRWEVRANHPHRRPGRRPGRAGSNLAQRPDEPRSVL